MDLPEQARLDAMAEALAHVLERQAKLEARLEQMEALAAHTRPESPSAAPVAPTPEVVSVSPPPLPEIFPPLLPPPLPSFPAPEPEPAIETRFGLGWINRIAVVTLLFGVAFLFKYAVDNEWIGPAMRVALGVAAAMLALILGEWISQGGQRVFAQGPKAFAQGPEGFAQGPKVFAQGPGVFAQGMTGLGLALLYLSFYATFGFYHLLAQGIAFGLMFATTIAAAALAVHYDSQAVAILGMVGGYLTPGLLSTGEDRLGALAGYSLVLAAGAAFLARIKRWPALVYIAFAGTWMLFSGWSSQFLSNDTRRPAFLWLTGAFALFFIASVLSRRLWLLSLNAGFYFVASFSVLDPLYRAGVGGFAAALAVLHAGIAVWEVVVSEKDPRFRQLAFAVAAVFLTVAIPLQFVSFRVTIFWAIEAAALAWLGSQQAAQIQTRVQVCAWFLFAAVFLRLFIADSRVFENNFFNGRLLTFGIVAVSLWIASRFANSQEARSVSYGAGHTALLWALAMEISAWAQRTADVQDAASVSSTGISVLMAVYAATLIVAGAVWRSAMNRILGLGLIALVVAKLYLFDVWQLSRGFRITAFLALGCVLLLVSYLYSRFKPALEKLWSTRPPGDTPSL